MFHSIDKGETWSNIMVGLPINQEVITFGSNSIKLFVHEAATIFLRLNRESELLPYKKVPPTQEKYPQFHAQIAIGSNFVLGGEKWGIFTTADSGETWLNLNDGLPKYEITTLAYDDSFLYAGTRYNGIWKRKLSEFIKTGLQPALADQLPLKFALYQNYPNPFNNSTTISFIIPNPADVKLKIYNLVGEEVKTLISENLKEGSYKINWAANNIASGVYIYRLQADNRVDVKKMILVK
jgi:hypothetical protein